MRRLTVTVVSDIQVRNDGGTEGLNGGKQILIRPETYKRLCAFSQVVEAVTEENLNLESLATMVVDRGLEALLRDILEKTAGTSSSEELQGVGVLYASFEKLSHEAPDVIYGFIAKTIRRGSGLAEWWRRVTEERSGHGGQ